MQKLSFGESVGFPKATRLLAFPIVIVLVLVIDSPWFAERYFDGQWVANVIVFGYFFLILKGASPRLQRIMWIGVFVATAGEVFFALVVGMYEYRLENVPLYVPPGHTLLFAGVFEFIREPWVLKRREMLTKVLLAIAATFSMVWLVWKNDVYGFLCFVVFLGIMYRGKESRLFFLSMYLAVAYLELFGTALGNWYWHPTLLNRWVFIPSGNPPSGISVFYFGFDIACLGFYMLSNLERRRRYDSFKAYRKRKKAAHRPELTHA